MTATAADRKPLTDVTFPTDRYLDQAATRGYGWQEQADLSDQLADATGIPAQEARAIIEALCAGLPIQVTHEHLLPGTGRVETTTGTYIIEHVYPQRGRYNALRLRGWGGPIPLAWDDYRRCAVPETDRTYRNA